MRPIKNHGVADLSIFGHLPHLIDGDLVVIALHLLHDDLAGQHAVTLLLQIKSHIEIGEIVLLERVLTDAQIEGAAVALIALQQGFAQGRLHHLR
jgi:hypothetical protein